MPSTFVLRLLRHGVLCAAALPVAGLQARADVVTDWNRTTGEIVTAAGLGTPPANRVMALVHTSSYDAANAISGRYPVEGARLSAPRDASIDAAISAAHRAALLKLLPAQQRAIDAAFQAAIAKVAPGPARDAGIAVGEAAASAVLARRALDKLAPDTYRPHAMAGVYVPTAAPAASQWALRTPWLMTSASQLRPPPPPALTSERWARDYNEVKRMGGKSSTARTAQQSEMASFWEATLPPIYHGMVQCVTEMPVRDVTRNARLMAAVTQAIDDTMVALFEAKYHYAFWRPVTAIRNGDIDGNDATEMDGGWTPFIETPMHPEYPCAHCALSAAVATVLEADIGAGPQPPWMTSSSAVQGAVRRWANLDAFVEEVATARILDGVHYRFSTEAGTALGRQVGQLAVARLLAAPQ